MEALSLAPPSTVHTLAAAAQSDTEKALTDTLLIDMEQINRKAHEAVGFTYAPLEQLAALQ